MDALTHIRLMAGYNLRMNRQVYQAASQLDQQSLAAPAGAYFDSVLGTLNHILVGDLLWLARFANHCEGYPSLQALSELPTPQSLDQLLYPHFGALGAVRRLVDEAILGWSAQELQSADLNMALAYRNRLGEPAVRNFGELVLHMFNHQTHHRGQVSTLLSQKGVDIDPTDFLLDIPRLDTD